MGLPGSAQIRLDVWQRAELRRLHVYLAHSKAAFYSQPNVTVQRDHHQQQQQHQPQQPQHQAQQQQQQTNTRVDSSASLLDEYLREADAVRAELAAWAEVEGRGPSRIHSSSSGSVYPNGRSQQSDQHIAFGPYAETDQPSASAIESKQVLEACLAIAEKYFNLGFTAGVRFCHEAMQIDSHENNVINESVNSEIGSDSWEDEDEEDDDDNDAEEHFEEGSSTSTSSCGSIRSRRSSEVEAIGRTAELETRSSEDRLKCEAWPLLHGTAACSGDSASNIAHEGRTLPKTTVWRGGSSPTLLRSTDSKRRSL